MIKHKFPFRSLGDFGDVDLQTAAPGLMAWYLCVAEPRVTACSTSAGRSSTSNCRTDEQQPGLDERQDWTDPLADGPVEAARIFQYFHAGWRRRGTMNNSTESNVIQTDRLVLAPHRIEDFSESAAMWADAAVVRYIGGTPSTVGESWARLHRYVGHWALLDYGYWAIREIHSQRFVGEVGLADFKRGLGERFDRSPECGWALMPWAQGQHFATEAIRAMLAWAAARPSMGPIVCMIHPDNKPSLRLAEKFAFHEFERTIFKGSSTILFERG